MDEEEPISLGVKSPIKRLGSTRKLIYFNNRRFTVAILPPIPAEEGVQKGKGKKSSTNISNP